MNTPQLVPFEQAAAWRSQRLSQPLRVDFELAELLANGATVEEAANALKLDIEFARTLVRASRFQELVLLLSKELEEAIYNKDPDQILEARKRKAVRTIVADLETGEVPKKRVEAAKFVWENAPSTQEKRSKLKQDEAPRIIVAVEVRDRLLEGLAKAQRVPLESVEAEFRELAGEEET
jgi:hypothetical protein